MLDVVVDTHDMRMVEFGQYPRLGKEATAQVRVVGGVEQDFDRDIPAHQAMAAAEHKPVATAAQFTVNLVAGERGLHQRAIDQQRSDSVRHRMDDIHRIRIRIRARRWPGRRPTSLSVFQRLRPPGARSDDRRAPFGPPATNQS